MKWWLNNTKINSYIESEFLDPIRSKARLNEIAKYNDEWNAYAFKLFKLREEEFNKRFPV